MLFETLVAGESRQINGPIRALRVLEAGVGAALAVDQFAVPVSATLLLALRAPEFKPFDRVTMTGPIVVHVVKTQDELLADLVR